MKCRDRNLDRKRIPCNQWTHRLLGAQTNFSAFTDKYQLTVSGGLVYELTKEMQQHFYAIERNTVGKNDTLEGRIRISTTSCIASSWLVNQHPEFLDYHPGVEIVVGLTLLSLLGRQSDIALRVGQPGPEALVGRRVGEVNFGLYASVD